MRVTISTLVKQFAEAIARADAKLPRAVNVRSKQAFQPGIGPHSESETIRLVMNELASLDPASYANYSLSVPYLSGSRQRCDICVGSPPEWGLVVEAKLFRLLGDNGKLNDNMLMHILSPYPQHRSAVTDCEKLVAAGPRGPKAIVIFGYEDHLFPMEPAIRAFEALARERVYLGDRYAASFGGLIHPIHKRGLVFGWGLRALEDDPKGNPRSA